MKGVLDIEFILSTLVFLSVITFVTFVIISNIPVFRSEASSEDLRARTYEISQLLLFDQGEPSNWDPTNVKRIGLSAGDKYVLSSTKINNLQTMCTNNYANVKSILDQNTTQIKINIVDSSGNQLLVCGPATSSGPEFQITRFAVLESNVVVKMSVSVL